MRWRCPECGAEFDVERVTSVGEDGFSCLTQFHLQKTCSRCGHDFEDDFRETAEKMVRSTLGKDRHMAQDAVRA